MSAGLPDGAAWSRRGFLLGAGAFALGGCATLRDGVGSAEDPNALFALRGKYERLSLAYQHLRIGATAPFSVLHVSDTHLTAAYEHEEVCRTGKAAKRTQTFGGRQLDALLSSLAWARDNVDHVLHTGDLIDFQSEANADLVRRHLGEGVFGSMGNHEFYSYLPDEKHTWQEPFKARSWDMLREVYPYDARFNAQVINGINFVCIDDVFGTVQPDQVDRFREEVRKGFPIVLAMHVPILTDEIWRATDVFWRRSGQKFRDACVPPPRGDATRQRTDRTTADFIADLKREPLLKAIVAGHEHITVQERFSPTAVQYLVGGNFMFHGQVLLFS